MSGAVLAPVVAATVWLGALAGIAEAADRVPRLGRLAQSAPAYGLALGVYATTFTVFGGVGFASRYGLSFLAFYVGVALSGLAVPVVWAPLGVLVRDLRLASPADLLAYRFASARVGALVTVFLAAGLLPYLSLQVLALSEAAAMLAGPAAPRWIGLACAAALYLFAAGVGVRYADPWARRPGLVATLAVETLAKAALVLVVAGAAVQMELGGIRATVAQLADPAVVEHLVGPVRDGPWVGLVLVAFAGAFLLPRQFHVAFVERPSDRALRDAAWVLPAVLFVLVLPIPVLWLAGRSAAPEVAPDLYVLAWSEAPALRTLAFLAGASAASAMVLAETLALSNMVVVHLVLPLRSLQHRRYRDLGAVRRATVLAMVLAGVAAHAVLPHPRSIVDLGVVSFTATLQLLPGVLATLFWPRATRAGFVAGLLGGGVTFVTWVAVPLLGATEPGWVDPRDAAPVASLAVNAALLVAVSLATRPTREQAAAAATCAGWLGESGRPPGTVAALVARVAEALGPELADAEVGRAREAAGIGADEERPLVLRRLAEQVEAALATQLGALAARRIVRGDEAGPVATGMRALAERRAPADPYDEVRQYLFAALQDLPFAVAAVDPHGDLVVWNQAAVGVTGLDVERVVGRPLSALPAPWDAVLAAEGTAEGERVVEVRHSALGGPGGVVVVFDDQTERRSIATRLAHRDRLATVGRLAAGVAHEVRNPLTGLLLVARNLEADSDDPDVRQRLALIAEEGARIERIVRGLLELAVDRPPPGRAAVAVRALVDRAVVLARLGAERGVTVSVDAPEALHVDADGEVLLQAVLNLVRNALQAGPDGSEVAVVAGADADGAWIDVVDRGPGVPEPLVARLFEPFFTTKAPGEGTGLGLAVSARLIEAQGGRLGYDRAAGRTRFRIEGLPVTDAP